MDIDKELKQSVGRARRGTASLLASMRKGTAGKCDRALAETQDAMGKTKEILTKAKTEAKGPLDAADRYVAKVERVQVDMDLAMTELSTKVMDKSLEGAEAAVTKLRKVLDRAERLVDVNRGKK